MNVEKLDLLVNFLDVRDGRKVVGPAVGSLLGLLEELDLVVDFENYVAVGNDLNHVLNNILSLHDLVALWPPALQTALQHAINSCLESINVHQIILSVDLHPNVYVGVKHTFDK